MAERFLYKRFIIWQMELVSLEMHFKSLVTTASQWHTSREVESWATSVKPIFSKPSPAKETVRIIQNYAEIVILHIWNYSVSSQLKNTAPGFQANCMLLLR